MGKSFRFNPNDDFEDQEEVHNRKNLAKQRKQERKSKKANEIDWNLSDDKD